MNTDVLKAEDKSEVYRLTDMVVREVSIVDRPANLRPFLIMKSEGGEGPELEPDGKGGFRMKAAPPMEADKPASDAAPDPVPAVKSLEIDDAVVNAALTSLSSEVEKVGRKLAAKREQAIRQAIELLMGVIEDTSKAVQHMTSTSKAVVAQLDAERAATASLRAEHETLKAQHVALVRSVSKARGNVQKSNALSLEERGDAGRVVWPRDMNEES